MRCRSGRSPALVRLSGNTAARPGQGLQIAQHGHPMLRQRDDVHTRPYILAAGMPSSQALMSRNSPPTLRRSVRVGSCCGLPRRSQPGSVPVLSRWRASTAFWRAAPRPMVGPVPRAQGLAPALEGAAEPPAVRGAQTNSSSWASPPSLRRRRGLPGLNRPGISHGGDEEDRTPDLRIANATLSQLSYVPLRSGWYQSAMPLGKPAAQAGDCASGVFIVSSTARLTVGPDSFHGAATGCVSASPLAGRRPARPGSRGGRWPRVL